MTQGGSQPSRRITWSGVIAFLGLLIAISAFVWQIFSSRSDKLAMESQIDNQATQIVMQDIQINLSADQNRLSYEQATVAAEQARVAAEQATIIAKEAGNEGQLQNQDSSNSESFALTATSLAEQSTYFEATRQAIEDKQRQIEATQTAISQPIESPVTMIRAEDIIPNIIGVDGELQQLMSFWRETNAGSSDGLIEPSTATANEYCYAMAWNTNEYGYHHLIVFRTPLQLTFADGGWHVSICIDRSIFISPDDVGRIQVDWLGKRYGIDSQPWQVTVTP